MYHPLSEAKEMQLRINTDTGWMNRLMLHKATKPFSLFPCVVSRDVENKKGRDQSYGPLQLFAQKDIDSNPSKVNILHDKDS